MKRHLNTAQVPFFTRSLAAKEHASSSVKLKNTYTHAHTHQALDGGSGKTSEGLTAQSEASEAFQDNPSGKRGAFSSFATQMRRVASHRRALVRSDVLASAIWQGGPRLTVDSNDNLVQRPY